MNKTNSRLVTVTQVDRYYGTRPFEEGWQDLYQLIYKRRVHSPGKARKLARAARAYYECKPGQANRFSVVGRSDFYVEVQV